MATNPLIQRVLPVKPVVETAGPMPPLPVKPITEGAGPMPPIVGKVVEGAGPMPPVVDKSGAITERLDYKPMAMPPGGLLQTTVGTTQNPQPPVNPQDWEADDSASELTRIISGGGDYIRQAQEAGLMAAGRRGLRNSSIAAGASQAEAIRAAAPLAQQNAQQAAQRNAIRVDADYQERRQQAELGSRAGLLGLEIDSRERIVAQQIAAEEANLGRQLTAQEQQQIRELASRSDLQASEFEARERMQGVDVAATAANLQAQIAAEETRLGRQLTSAELQQQRDIAMRTALQTEQLGVQRELTQAEIAQRDRSLAAQIAAEETRLGRQLTSQELQQQRDIAARSALQTEQLSFQETQQRNEIAMRERLAAADITAAEARLGRQLNSEELRQVNELAARREMLDAEIGSRETLTREELASLERRVATGEASAMDRALLAEQGATQRANLDAATRVQTQAMANLSEEQRSYLQYYVQTNNTYQNSIDALWANVNMPAPARDFAIQQFTALRDANLNVAAAVYGASMNWGTGVPPTGNPPAQPPAGGIAPGASPTYGGTPAPMPSGLTAAEQAEFRAQNSQYQQQVTTAYGGVGGNVNGLLPTMPAPFAPVGQPAPPVALPPAPPVQPSYPVEPPYQPSYPVQPSYPGGVETPQPLSLEMQWDDGIGDFVPVGGQDPNMLPQGLLRWGQ